MYFIKDGEFEVTKAVSRDFQTQIEDASASPSVEKKLQHSPVKNTKVQNMLRSRSNALEKQMGLTKNEI